MGYEMNNTKSDFETAEAMNNPKPGDRFTEMYSFYVYVLEVTESEVVFMECNPPCEVPREGKVGTLPLVLWRKRYAYGSIPGYSVCLCERGNDVHGWVGEAKDKLEMTDNPFAGKLRFCNICKSYGGDEWYTATGNHVACQDHQDVAALRDEAERLAAELADLKRESQKIILRNVELASERDHFHAEFAAMIAERELLRKVAKRLMNMQKFYTRHVGGDCFPGNRLYCEWGMRIVREAREVLEAICD